MLRTGLVSRLADHLNFTRRALGWHLLSLWILAIVAAGLEGFGILLFIPILSRFVAADGEVASDAIGGFLQSWAGALSIEALLGLAFLAFALKGFLTFAIGLYRARILSRARERMRMEIFHALDRARIADLRSRPLGSLGNLLIHEVSGVAFAMDQLCAALGALTTAVLLFGLAVALQPLLSVALVVSGTVSLSLGRYFARRRAAVSAHQTTAAGDMSSLAVETTQSLKYLRATERFSVLRRAFGNAAHAARQAEDRAAWIDEIRGGTREPLLVLWIAGVFYGFVVVLGQSLSVITDGILLFYRVSLEVTFFLDRAQRFAGQVGAIDGYCRLRDELRDAAEPATDGVPARYESEIRLEGVKFGYGEGPVLNGVDLSIGRRQTVAVVGISGAGKSTLIDVVAGCLEPTEGAVRVDGVDLRELSRPTYRGLLGYVTQESVMFSGSVRHNITMCWDRELTPEEQARATEAARLAHCLDLIESLEHGWDTKIGERGQRLSGGERQRLAIARELYREPRLLILDEATSALDAVSERAIQKSLELLHGRVAVLLVAHRLSTIRHADMVYVLDGGQITESGPFEELAERPEGRFRELCLLQRVV